MTFIQLRLWIWEALLLQLGSVFSNAFGQRQIPFLSSQKA